MTDIKNEEVKMASSLTSVERYKALGIEGKKATTLWLEVGGGQRRRRLEANVWKP